MKMESPAVLQANGAMLWRKDLRQNRRLLLIHTAVALLLPLLVSGISLLLENQLANTGGLAGVGMRTTLLTIQTVLSYAVEFLLPFWQVGILFVALRLWKGQSVSASDLFAGFHRWGVFLRLNLYRIFRYGIEVLCGIFLATFVYILTPLSDPLFRAADQISADPTLSQATGEQITEALFACLSFWDVLPYYVLCAIAIGVLLLPVVYRFRMADYLLLDTDSNRALAALRESTLIMRGNARSLFRLDLRFWWYYLLYAGAIVLPLVLDLGTPWNLLLASAIQFALIYLFRGPVECAYACAYDSLKTPQGGNESPC